MYRLSFVDPTGKAKASNVSNISKAPTLKESGRFSNSDLLRFDRTNPGCNKTPPVSDLMNDVPARTITDEKHARKVTNDAETVNWVNKVNEVIKAWFFGDNGSVTEPKKRRKGGVDGRRKAVLGSKWEVWRNYNSW